MTNVLSDDRAKGCGGLLMQKKQKKHKEQDCKNNHACQDKVKVPDNCSCQEGAEVKDCEECGNERSQFLGSTEDVTASVSVQLRENIMNSYLLQGLQQPISSV